MSCCDKDKPVDPQPEASSGDGCCGHNKKPVESSCCDSPEKSWDKLLWLSGAASFLHSNALLVHLLSSDVVLSHFLIVVYR